MKELSVNEIECVSGGNPVLVMATYVAVRYVASRMAVGIATGVVVGATEAYLDS
jgi:phosphoribosylaminoimidazole (AIR) synthetase